MPLELQPEDFMTIGATTPPGYNASTAMIHDKSRWIIGAFIDPGHRRDLDYNEYHKLQSNDDTHFIIQQPGYLNYYMEQQDEPDAGKDFAALILKDSTASTSNSSGISWRVLYDSANETYEFRNWKDSNVSLGFYNVWYVLLSGNTNMNLNSVVDCKLTLTGEQPDEYYITQQTPTGVTVTLSRVSFTHDSTHDASGSVTSWPMTWYEVPDLTLSKFIIRPWDAATDPSLDTTPVIDISDVNIIS